MCSGICAGYAYYGVQYGYEVRHLDNRLLWGALTARGLPTVGLMMGKRCSAIRPSGTGCVVTLGCRGQADGSKLKMQAIVAWFAGPDADTNSISQTLRTCWLSWSTSVLVLFDRRLRRAR